MKRRVAPLLSGWIFTVLASLIGSSPQLHAQELGYRAFGLRGGLGVDPDQFVFGAHLDLGTLAKQVRLQPSFDIGFGDNLTVGTINVDAHYLFTTKGSGKPYAGGGLTIAIANREGGSSEVFGNSDVGAGISLVGGIQWGRPPRRSKAAGRYLFEIRVGVGDVPNFKFLFGINF